MLTNNCIFCNIDQSVDYGACKFCYFILPWIKATSNSRCNKCQNILSFAEQRSCFDFNTIYAVFSYQDPIKQLILELKFNQKLIYSKFLGTIMADYVLNTWYKHRILPDCLIAVPLHPNRLRTRGFNQAYEIARYVSQITKIPVDNNICNRVKNTATQMSLAKHKRSINISNAFSAKQMNYKHIAILDDVVTTGNTIKSLCNAIKKVNQDIKIDIWCVCRA